MPTDFETQKWFKGQNIFTITKRAYPLSVIHNRLPYDDYQEYSRKNEFNKGNTKTFRYIFN